jgi:hypothetical protein
MRELTRRIIWTVGLAPVSAVVSFLTQRILGDWGILDPFAMRAGGWLRVNAVASIDITLWIVALIVFGCLYGVALFIIWRTRGELGQPNEFPNVAAEPTTNSLSHDVWLQDAVCYALHGRWLGDNEQAFGDGQLINVSNIAQKMREMAGNSQYLIWGKTDLARLHQKIPEEFWNDNQIDLIRLLAGVAKNVRTERVISGHSTPYLSLRVNKLQTERIWPTIEAAGSREAPMHEVIKHVATRIGDMDKFWPKARLAIRQAAIDDRLKIHGHKSEETISTHTTSYSAVKTLIPRTYWDSVDIWITAANKDEPMDKFINHTFSHKTADGLYTTTQMTVYYAKLSANWKEVINLWP